MYTAHLWIFANSACYGKTQTSCYFSSSVYGTLVKYKMNTSKFAGNSKF